MELCANEYRVILRANPGKAGRSKPDMWGPHHGSSHAYTTKLGRYFSGRDHKVD